jgi:excisionase family DNA binding protein
VLGPPSPAHALDLTEIITDPAALTPMGAKTLLLQVAAALVALAAAPPLEAPSEADAEPLLTVDEVAARLRFVPAYVYELIRLGRLPAVREGKYVRARSSAAGVGGSGSRNASWPHASGYTPTRSPGRSGESSASRSRSRG